MVVQGYVALKIHKIVLHYADWTNTRRRYRTNGLTSNNVLDLRRIFNGKTLVLIVDIEKTLFRLQKILGPLNTSRCIEVENVGSISQILNVYLSLNRKKKSYYNYQREHWLTLLSVVNVHLLLNGGELPKNKVLKILERELVKYKRDIPSNVLLEKFISMGIYVYLTNDISNDSEPYKDSIISLPVSRMA